MTRRRQLVFGMLAGLLALGVGGCMALAPVETGTIRPGMTLKESVEILGQPDTFFSSNHGALAIWNRKDGEITIGFDKDLVIITNKSHFDRLRGWLGF